MLESTYPYKDVGSFCAYEDAKASKVTVSDYTAITADNVD